MKKESWYQQTEALLYAYPRVIKRIRALQQQLDVVRQQLEPALIPSYQYKVSSNRQLTVPLERAVIERLEGDRVQEIQEEITELQQMATRVECGIEGLNEEQSTLVRMRYFEGKQWHYIADELGMDDNTYYRKNGAIIHDLAYSLGLMPKKNAGDYLGLYVDQALWSKTEGIKRE